MWSFLWLQIHFSFELPGWQAKSPFYNQEGCKKSHSLQILSNAADYMLSKYFLDSVEFYLWGWAVQILWIKFVSAI